jgi:hypothetical protein
MARNPKKTASKRQTKKGHQQVLNATAEQKRDAAKTVGVDVSDSDISKAREEGALQAERDAGRDAYKYATDGNLASDSPPRRQFTGYDEIQQYAGMLAQGVDQFTAAIAEDAPVPLPEEKVYGLLALERNGQNRTDYVKAMIKRLGLTKDDPLPGGGPGYTNDIHPVSDLYS